MRVQQKLWGSFVGGGGGKSGRGKSLKIFKFKIKIIKHLNFQELCKENAKFSRKISFSRRLGEAIMMVGEEVLEFIEISIF